MSNWPPSDGYREISNKDLTIKSYDLSLWGTDAKWHKVTKDQIGKPIDGHFGIARPLKYFKFLTQEQIDQKVLETVKKLEDHEEWDVDFNFIRCRLEVEYDEIKFITDGKGTSNEGYPYEASLEKFIKRSIDRLTKKKLIKWVKREEIIKHEGFTTVV